MAAAMAVAAGGTVEAAAAAVAAVVDDTLERVAELLPCPTLRVRLSHIVLSPFSWPPGRCDESEIGILQELKDQRSRALQGQLPAAWIRICARTGGLLYPCLSRDRSSFRVAAFRVAFVLPCKAFSSRAGRVTRGAMPIDVRKAKADILVINRERMRRDDEDVIALTGT